jgi:hypothetical protein
VNQFLQFIVAVLFFASCSNTPTPAGTSSPAGDSMSKNSVSDSLCCFHNREELLPFLPAACGDVKEKSPDYTFDPYCAELAGDSSVCTKLYLGPDGKQLEVQLCDYCRHPATLDAHYKTRLKEMKSNQAVHEMNEFEVAGVYKGFSVFDPQTKTVSILATIDARFSVQITGKDATSATHAMTLLNGLPLKELAAFE